MVLMSVIEHRPSRLVDLEEPLASAFALVNAADISGRPTVGGRTRRRCMGHTAWRVRAMRLMMLMIPGGYASAAPDSMRRFVMLRSRSRRHAGTNELDGVGSA